VAYPFLRSSGTTIKLDIQATPGSSLSKVTSTEAAPSAIILYTDFPQGHSFS
jgi:hypothetical protein